MESGIMETKEKVNADVKAWNKQGHTQSETLTEAFRRVKVCSSDFDLPCIIEHKSFLNLSLKNAKPSPNFCKNVPAPLEFTKSISWRTSRCGQLAPDHPMICDKLIDEVQNFCQNKNEQKKK
ncbi:hypothetical protein CH352_09755 [Leptospira hartskeerlii]|uniref:Uncharacterized protein n=2 Tax=Leptospira hartskeerlii TaxID=2023177 RepID=A0A2M9XI42_9LEPT|nr:hypothetical protein CH357_02020 [Leptospira hartskeerlii]PJZ34012.1 hypothetical protein CH352_09755 [Leptospira hartskeerlii]